MTIIDEDELKFAIGGYDKNDLQTSVMICEKNQVNIIVLIE